MAIENVEFLKYSPSILAAAAIYCALGILRKILALED
jgi:hypothetical protein